MIPHDKTQDAINESELVADLTLADNTPVTVSNRALLALIEAAKGGPTHAVYVEQLETAMQSAIDVLRAAIDGR